MEKAQIVVTIPIYKETPSPSEVLSLKQGIAVLGAYSLVIFAPENLNLRAYFALFDDFQVERFPAKYFTSIASYNDLMLSPVFYQRFSSYEYLLIYQPDAYVFRDELLEWAEKDYDYIGAPWVVPVPLTNPNKRIIFDLSKRMVGKVGNGGLSLRKVSTHLKVTRGLRPLIKIFPKNEDFFWAYFLPLIYPRFSRPPMLEALGFAFELAPQKSFEMNNHQLPFGCHAWEKYEPEFWAAYIPSPT